MIALPFFKGFIMGAGLIIAIGAQNAFVLKQGIQRQHLFLTAMTCALCDGILIVTGVLGIGLLLTDYPILENGLRWGGFLFLVAYGLRSFINAARPQGLVATDTPVDVSKFSTFLIAAAFSFLNPHAYVDTFLLLGSIGAQHPDEQQIPFIIGAVLASIVWFFSLAFAASKLTPIFKNPRAWQILEIAIGLGMLGIAIGLII